MLLLRSDAVTHVNKACDVSLACLALLNRRPLCRQQLARPQLLLWCRLLAEAADGRQCAALRLKLQHQTPPLPSSGDVCSGSSGACRLGRIHQAAVVLTPPVELACVVMSKLTVECERRMFL
jgi:hypothetical protein